MSTTALEFCRDRPELELTPLLRVVKYFGLESGALSPEDIEKAVRLYPYFEEDPELVVGAEKICELTGLEPEALESLLVDRRQEIPFLGTPLRPMIPTIGLRMIRAIMEGHNPVDEAARQLYSLADMAKQTGINVATLSRYIKEHGDRIPHVTEGHGRRFPAEAADSFRRISQERARRARPTATRPNRWPRQIQALESEMQDARELAQQLTKTLNRLAGGLRRLRSLATMPGEQRAARGYRRSGGGKTGTIVEACRKVLEHGDSMKVADITGQVVELGVSIKAKNPNVTVSSILSSYEAFERVRRGYYRLATSTDPALAASPPGGWKDDGGQGSDVEACRG